MANYLTEPELKQHITEARAGNFDNLYKDICLLVSRAVKYDLLHHDKDIEDLKQECALTVFVNLHRFDLSMSCFSYLTSIVLNQLRQWMRLQKNHDAKLVTLFHQTLKEAGYTNKEISFWLKTSAKNVSQNESNPNAKTLKPKRSTSAADKSSNRHA